MVCKKRIQFLIMIFLLFIVTGVLHIALADFDYCACIVQFIYGSCVIMWAVSIERRIIDRRVRYLLLTMSAFMLLYVVLQICKYRLFFVDGLLPRYIWYAYYIPMTGVPVTLYFIALYMNLTDDESPKRVLFWPIIPAILLVAGFLTNEIHYLAFNFPPGAPADDGVKEYGVISYLFWGYIGFVFLISLIIMIRKCRLSVARKQFWFPLLPIFFGGLWLLSDAVGIGIRFNDVLLFNIGEIFGFMAIGFVEISVQIGMIPSNIGYEKLFELTPVLAAIMDAEGQRIYCSGVTEKMFEPGENVKIKSKDICGGTIRWAVDITDINLLNQQLTDLTEQIETRNEYLKTQNSLKEEQSAVEARSRVYDQIAEIIKTQMLEIDRLVKDEKKLSQNLTQIAVYNAYIKRRSNLELMKENVDVLPLTELVTAMSESAEYLSLYGVEMVVSATSTDKVDVRAVILIYEFYEYVVETMLSNLKQCSVILGVKEEYIFLRMIVSLKKKQKEMICSSWRKEEMKKADANIEVSKDGLEQVISLTIKKNRKNGGEI